MNFSWVPSGLLLAKAGLWGYVREMLFTGKVSGHLKNLHYWKQSQPHRNPLGSVNPSSAGLLPQSTSQQYIQQSHNVWPNWTNLVIANILVCTPWYQLWPLYLILINPLFLKHKPEIDCGSDSERERGVILTQIPRWVSRGWHKGPCTSNCSSPCLSCQSSLPQDCSMQEMLLLISPAAEVMLCWLYSVTQRHHCFNGSWQWAEIWLPLSGLGNNMGQGSLSGLEQHSSIYIHTTKLLSLSIHPGSTPWLPDCCFTWTMARQCCKLGQSEPRQTCGWAHN